MLHRIRAGLEGLERKRLYSLIFVKVIEMTMGHIYDFFLFPLANRFNTAYDLLLNTGPAVRW